MKYYLKKSDEDQWFDLDDAMYGDFGKFVTEKPDGAVIGTVNPDAKSVSVDEDRLHLFVQRQSVESSNIESVGYVLSRKVLIVEFTTGSVYTYKNVPREVYTDMLEAPSKGKYFYKHVRGKFASIKVEDVK